MERKKKRKFNTIIHNPETKKLSKLNARDRLKFI